MTYARFDIVVVPFPFTDLADASLLWVAEQTGVCGILTIDLRDFGAYRLPGGKALTPVL